MKTGLELGEKPQGENLEPVRTSSLETLETSIS